MLSQQNPFGDDNVGTRVAEAIDEFISKRLRTSGDSQPEGSGLILRRPLEYLTGSYRLQARRWLAMLSCKTSEKQVHAGLQ